MPVIDWSLLYREDPYRDFPTRDYVLDLQGWNADAALIDHIVAERRPHIIIEVGSWKGASAVRFAESLKRHGIDGRILCVDTWLGALEFWTNDMPDFDRFAALQIRNGFPQVYYQFLANVILSGHQDIIIPLPNTSQTAARFLSRRGVRADLIYVDASHEEIDVYADLTAYWELLESAGVMFGDDYGNRDFPGVRAAVDRFAHERGEQLEVISGWYWRLCRHPRPGSQTAIGSLAWRSFPTQPEFLKWWQRHTPDTRLSAEDSFALMSLSHSIAGGGSLVSVGEEGAAAAFLAAARLGEHNAVTTFLPLAEHRDRFLCQLQNTLTDLGIAGAVRTLPNALTASWNMPIRLLYVGHADSEALQPDWRRLTRWVCKDGIVCALATSTASLRRIDADETLRAVEPAGGLRAWRKIQPGWACPLERPEAVQRFADRCSVFVLHHGTPPRTRRAYLEVVNLNELDLPPGLQDNRLAESRIFLSNKANESRKEYLGFVTGGWDQKMANLIPLDAFHDLEAMLDPNKVLAALISPNDMWIEHCNEAHPGMTRLVHEMSEVTGIPLTSRPTFWANNFIAHCEVVREFLSVWRRLFGHFLGRYSFDPPFDVGAFDGNRKFAYLAERFAMFYFASRADLEVVPIPAR